MPQDDPFLAAARRAKATPQTPADPFLQAAQRTKAGGSTPSAVIPNDTTVGPEGIRANDEEGVQRYLRETDSLARNAVPLGTPVRDMTPRPRASVPAAGRGAPGFSLGTEALDIARGIGKTLYGGAVGTIDLASKINPFNINEWVSRPREQIQRSGEAVTFPIAAAKHTRDVTQRALAGEDVTPGEIAEAWSGGAFGLLGAVEGVRGLPEMLPRRGAARAPVSPSTRPPVPHELDFVEPGFAPKPAPATPPQRPIGMRATRAQLDKIITQQRSALTPSPAELDALIQKQQADLEAGIAGPAERHELYEPRESPEAQAARTQRNLLGQKPLDEETVLGGPERHELDEGPGRVPAQNPLTELDDAIAKDRSDIEALEAELAARRARETEPDKLRELPDEALGETPPPEQSAAAAQDTKIPGIAERILQEERRKEQRPFEGAEQRAPERLQALLDEASRRMTTLEQRHALERKGFMGTGAKSMTPEDVAGTRILGATSSTAELNRAALDKIYQSMSDADLREHIRQAKKVTRRPNATREQIESLRELEAESDRRKFNKGKAKGTASSAAVEYIEEQRQRREGRQQGRTVDLDKTLLKSLGAEPPEVVGKIEPPPPPEGFTSAEEFNTAKERASQEPFLHEQMRSVADKVDAGEPLTPEEIQILNDYGVKVLGEPPLPAQERADLARGNRAEGSQALHDYFESPETQERITGTDKIAGEIGPQGPRHGTDVNAAVGIIKEGLRPGSSVSMKGGRDFEGYPVTLEFESVHGAEPYSSPLGPTMHEGAAKVRGAKRIKRVFFDASDFITREDAQAAYNKLRTALDENGYRNVPIEAARYVEEMPGTKQEGFEYGGEVSFEGLRSFKEHVQRLGDLYERASPEPARWGGSRKDTAHRNLWREAEERMDALSDESLPPERVTKLQGELDIVWKEMERVGIVEPEAPVVPPTSARSGLGPERMPGESVLDYSRRIREQVDPEDVRTPGTTGGGMPPLPPEKPAAPIDMSGLDVQIEALRAEQARLREAAERAKVENPAEHPSFARKARLREKGGAGQEAQKAREKLPSRREYQNEIRSLQGTLRMVEKSLQRYPESDTRPHAVEYRNELLQTKLAAMERLNNLMELKKGTPYKRPPLKGPKGTMGPNLGGEGGFALNPFAKKQAAAPPLTAAEKAFNSKIASGQVADRLPFKQRMANIWHWLAQKHTESAHTTRALVRQIKRKGGEISVPERADLWHKAALDSEKRIEGALTGEGPGYFDPNTGAWTPMGPKSLKTILEPIAGDQAALDRVANLLVAEHVPEWHAKGRKTPFTDAEAAAIVRNATPRTIHTAAQIREWMNSTGEMLVRSGALSPELWQKLREEYPFYIPFERAFEGEGMVPGKGSATRGARGPGSVRPPFRKATAKGSEADIGSPFETIPDYGRRMIRYNDLFQATRSLLDMVNTHSDKVGNWARLLKSRPVQTANPMSEFGELLSDRALRMEGDVVNIYNPKTNAVETWKLEPLLADGLRGLGSKEWDFVTELLGAGKKGVQFGVTNNPIFGIANFLMDNAGRPTVSGATHYPLANTGVKAPYYETMGGGFGVAQESSGFAESMRRALPGRSKLRSQQRARTRLARRLTGTTPTPIKAVNSIGNFLKQMSVPFEETTRRAEFVTQKKTGLNDLEAYVNSQETLGNFGEHPTAAYMRWLIHTFPFSNPHIQGLRTTYEAGRFRPGSSALKAAITITAPTVALYYLQRNDQEIEDHRNGPGGSNNWFIRPSNIIPGAPSDVILRVPKPHAIGAISASSVEHALDMWRDHDEHGFERIFRDLGQQLAQSSMNPILGVPIALNRNKAFGTGVPIVPEDQKDRLPEEQLGAQPNYALQDLSRLFPERFRFSPAKAQYVLGQAGGTLGRYLPERIDMLLNSDRRPERRPWSDNPISTRFFERTPSSAVAPIRDVYDDARRGNQIMETLKGLTAAGDASGIQRLIEEHGSEFGTAMRDQIFSRQLSELGNLAQYFANSESLSPHERREGRDLMLRQMTELARTFHELMHEK